MNIHNVLPRGIVKGRLFYPIEQFGSKTYRYPAVVNPAHERGWWLTFEEFAGKAPFGKHDRYLLLDKSLWLSPLCAEDGMGGLSHGECLNHISHAPERGAAHLAVIDESGNESSRGFLVSNHWLERTRSR